jgi:molybdenum cofactor cytidylyltransferase
VAAKRAGVIVAAGASERMGQPKALLPWCGSTLVDYAIQQARLAGVEDLAVVLGPATRDLRLDALIAFNPDPETGRSTSIRLGAERLADDVTAIVIQSVDQPVPTEVIRMLFQTVESGARAAIPTFRGRRGHPVCFSGELLSELRSVSEDTQGLRAVVRRHPATEVAVDSEAVIWNLNDPAAYAAALQARPAS